MPAKDKSKISPLVKHALTRKANPNFSEHIKSFFKKNKIYNRSNPEECPEKILSGSEIPNINYSPYFIAASSLGSSKSTSTSLGGNLNIGLGIKIFKKDGLVSLSGGLGGSFSDDKSFVANVDMNGDGLVDLVKRENGVINYYPHSYIQDVNGPTHSFAIDGITLVNLDDNEFYKGFTTSFNTNIGLSAGTSETAGGHAGLTGSTSRTITEIFITDANGDGLPDLSINGVILFNSLDKTNGIPSFDQSSEATENLIVKGEAIEEVIEVDLEFPEIEWPKYDVVKVLSLIHI